MMIEKKNPTMFAAEMRKSFENLLNFIATEQDSDRDAALECLNKAGSYAFPTHYEKALMLALYKALSDVNYLADYNIGQKK